MRARPGARPSGRRAPGPCPPPRRRASPSRSPRPQGAARQVLPFPKPAAPRPEPVAPAAASPRARRRKERCGRLAPGLARTRSSGFIARLGELFAGRKEIDPSIVGEIEKVLLTADIGVRTSQKLLDEIRSRCRARS